MNFRYIILITSICLIITSNCHKNDNVENNEIPAAVSDSILYIDLVPDLVLRCTLDTVIDNYGNKLIKGEFGYRLDINNDSISDFLLVGRQWGEIGQRSFSDSAYIEGLNSSAFIGYKIPFGNCWCPCNSATILEGGKIDKNLSDGWVQRVLIHATNKGLDCSWHYYGEERQYLAVWLHVNNEINYGWIGASGFSRTKVGDYYVMEFVIYDFAINLRNGKSICAGQKK
jgi:hypothetical protein